MGRFTGICQEIYGVVTSIFVWLDGKKTTIGALFFVLKDVIIVPYYTQFHGTVPPQLDFWLGVVATLFTTAGIAHKTIKEVQRRVRANSEKDNA